MKQLLEEYIASCKNGYKDTHGIRWMSSKNPELWNKLVEATSFLDDNAKPKQRCWHILNDVWEHPRCPTTNKKVKWHENRYLTYISIRAQMINPDNQSARKKAMMEKYGVEHALQSKKLKQKCADTWMEKYGVDNPSKNSAIKDKIKNTLIDTGHWRSDEDKEDQELYNQQVDNYSAQSWRDHYDKINPNNYERGFCTYHLDHIYPKIRGYVEGIDPKIMGHWTNLRVIHYTENLAKHGKTDMTKDELLEIYNLSR